MIDAFEDRVLCEMFLCAILSAILEKHVSAKRMPHPTSPMNPEGSKTPISILKLEFGGVVI